MTYGITIRLLKHISTIAAALTLAWRARAEPG